MPERQHPPEQAKPRPLAPAGILALARNRTAPLLRVADQRGSDVERSEEQTEALAHTTRLAAGRRCVHRRRRPPCAHPHRRISRLERPRWRLSPGNAHRTCKAGGGPGDLADPRVSRKTRPQNCPVTGRKRAPGALAVTTDLSVPAAPGRLSQRTMARSGGRTAARFRTCSRMRKPPPGLAELPSRPGRAARR